jgi:hypothetical protein
LKVYVLAEFDVAEFSISCDYLMSIHGNRDSAIREASEYIARSKYTPDSFKFVNKEEWEKRNEWGFFDLGLYIVEWELED